MKVIKYQLQSSTNIGTEEEPVLQNTFLEKEITCSDDMLATNEEIAKLEAYNGAYVIEDVAEEAVHNES